MTGRRLYGLLARGCVVAVAPMLLGGTGLTNNLEARVLAAHNRERSAMGIVPLAWDDRLASSAQAWADYLGNTGKFEHAGDDPRDVQGENLWAGTKGHYSAEEMVDGWIVEKRNYRPGPVPGNSLTGDYGDVGHYTQVMWRKSDAVGCAIARSQVEDVLVCRYSQAGNVIGERPF